MEKVGLVKRWERIGLVTVASLLMLASGSRAFAQHSGGFHGSSHGGGGFHGGGFRGFHGGGFGGYHGGGFGGYHGGHFGGYHGFYGYRGGWGWGPRWGLGLGLYLSALPWYYTTFWWDGVPYYYVENNYYLWDPDADEYEQVQPPPEVSEQAENGQQDQSSQVSEAPPQLYAYPKKGQTPQQQATDKRECGRWASAQTGLNPADATAAAQAAPGNAQPDQGGAAANAGTPATAQQWQNYLRAEGACLEARGYTVE